MKNTTWNTTPPPMTGEQIVAVGRILWTNGMCSGTCPFTAMILWDRVANLGWLDANGHAIASHHNDRVVVDYWLPSPIAPRPVHEP